MLLHSDTLSWSWANQCLLFHTNDVYFVSVICVCLHTVNYDVQHILWFSLLFFLFLLLSLSTSCTWWCPTHIMFFFCLHLVHGGVQYCVVYFAFFVFLLCLVVSLSRLPILHCPFWISSFYFECIWCFA